MAKEGQICGQITTTPRSAGRSGNLLKAPGYGLVNLNVHYDTDVTSDYLKGAIFFFEVKNVLNKTYVASANNITDTICAVTGLPNPGSILATTGTGSIYAGAPGPCR